MKGRITLFLLAIGVLAFACGPKPRGGEMPSTARARIARAHTHEGPALASSLDVRIADGVQFQFRVTNTLDRRIEVNFPNGQTHDVVVLDSLGREVWRWSDGRMFTQNLQNKELRSSDTISYDGRWTDAPRGRYVAVATLASENYPLVQRTEFVVR